jgi:hypothetical protein
MNYVKYNNPKYFVSQTFTGEYEVYSEVVGYRPDGSTTTFRNSCGFFPRLDKAQDAQRMLYNIGR